jgi:flavin reductase (DIM6/NTAB) family NADH-FMN oxidoreductase RutF
MSSAFWLGNTAILGLGTGSQTLRNLRRTGECVLNLPSADLVTQVTRLRLTTGENPMPAEKAEAGYQYEPDKFGRAGLKRLPAETVVAARVAECPVNLEARVVHIYPVSSYDPDETDGAVTVEVRVTRVHVHPDLLLAGAQNRIDPDRWQPLIMSFQQFYGLGDRVHPSRLASDDR